MTLRYPDLPTWQFEVEEVSMGVYRASAKDKQGRLIEKTGVDVNQLLEDLRASAAGFARKPVADGS